MSWIEAAKPQGKDLFFKQIIIQETAKESQQSTDARSVFEKVLQAESFHLNQGKAERWKWRCSLVESEAPWVFFTAFTPALSL